MTLFTIALLAWAIGSAAVWVYQLATRRVWVVSYVVLSCLRTPFYNIGHDSERKFGGEIWFEIREKSGHLRAVLVTNSDN